MRRSAAAPQTPDVVVETAEASAVIRSIEEEENDVDADGAALRADLDATADPARNSSNNSISCLNHKLPPHLGHENRHGRFCNDGNVKRECQDGMGKTQFPKETPSEDAVQSDVTTEVDHRRDGRGGFETHGSSSCVSEALSHHYQQRQRAHSRSAAASSLQYPQHPQHQPAREVDEQGNTWLTDEAGRQWIIDEAGRQWRLGSDGRQYVIDSAGVKWTVKETEGRRRLWRRNERGETVYAEEDGVEWVVNDEGAAARRRDEAGNEVVKDAEGVEWILDEAGRRWRENEKGQTVLTDEDGRVWKFSDGDEKDGRRNMRVKKNPVSARILSFFPSL